MKLSYYPANWLLLSGVVVITGRWARGQSLEARTVVALFIVALAVTLLSAVDSDIANALAILSLLAVTYEYAPDILRSVERAVEK